MKKALKKKKRKEIFENWIWKVFPNRKKRGKKKTRARKKNVTNTKNQKVKGVG